MEVRSTIRKYIISEIMHEMDQDVLGDDEPLIEGGIIDSMNLIKLVTFVNEKFGVEIGEDDLDMDNFRTVNALSSFLRQKMQSP